MTASELQEHAGYLADEVKMRSYRRAIRQAVAHGATSVLDLGSGSGVLGLMAATEGAEHVYAVDSGSIIGPATDLANATHVRDAIVHIHGNSTEINLPDHVDLAVCDQIGGFVHDAGVLGFFADARRRHLKSDGVLIPNNFRLFLAPVTCSKVRGQIDLWGSRPEGIDFSNFRELAVNSEHRIEADECVLLSSGTIVATIPADQDQPFVGSGFSSIEVAGRCDGLVGWFEADLGGGVTVTNHPSVVHRMQRWCNFYPISNPLHVRPGEHVRVDVDVRPLINAVTWRSVVTDANGVTKSNERHSTLLGQFLSPDDLPKKQGTSVRATTLGSAVCRALALADGTMSIDEILTIVREQFGDDLVVSANQETLRGLVRRFTAPA